MTIVDSSAVIATTNGELVFVGPEQVDHVVAWDTVAPDRGALAKFQQPSGTLSLLSTDARLNVAAITDAGEIVEIQIDGDTIATLQRGLLEGDNPLAPIAHGRVVCTRLSPIRPRWGSPATSSLHVPWLEPVRSCGFGS